MISLSELLSIANEKLIDAETLLNAHRYDGAVYICGYAVELALKHKICLTLNWADFPFTTKEFERYKSLKTHDLDVLLSFTGIEGAIKSTHLVEWSALAIWNPEARYMPKGRVSSSHATLMVNSAKILVELL